MPKSILERLKQGVVLGDGGYLLALENRGYVQAGPFTPEVTIEHPNALRALHEEFLFAGAEVLQVLAFYASENKLAQIGYCRQVILAVAALIYGLFNPSTPPFFWDYFGRSFRRHRDATQ